MHLCATLFRGTHRGSFGLNGIWLGTSDITGRCSLSEVVSVPPQKNEGAHGNETARTDRRNTDRSAAGRTRSVSLCRPGCQHRIGDFDPRNRLVDRIEAKLAELAGDGIALSARTFRRYIAAYRRDGMAGLVDRRRTRGRSPTGRVDQRVVALLEAAAAERLHRSTGTRSRVINTVSLRAAVDEMAGTRAATASSGADVSLPEA